MFFSKIKIKQIVLIIFLLLLLAYVSNITNIPDSLILFQNQNIDIKTIAGIRLEETIPVGAGLNSETITSTNSAKEEKKYNLTFLGLNVKTVTASIVKNTKVVPLGDIAGLKLYTKGVLVVGMSEIKGEDGITYKPYENTGIEQGDAITKINDEEINTTEELIKCISKAKGQTVNITYEKNNDDIKTTLTPVKTAKNTYKIGLWVRDSAAGIGTLSFYNPSKNTIVALGHGIQDIDTHELVEISSGELVTAEIANIQKGEKNKPGKIEGTIENGSKIAKINNNTEYGIYAEEVNKNKLGINSSNEIEVASRKEIKTGKAHIICTLENNIKKEYEIEIEKIYTNNNQNNKSMIVKITDKELIEKTGGIIQGMSGAPIIQNGKLVGALTHVFVSDPTKGYGVFADAML